MVDIKFCGLTRVEDARMAAALGARYVGAIFAESPRRLAEEDARRVLAEVASGVARVGVFGAMRAAEIAATAERAGLDVVQLHDDPGADTIGEVRRRWSGRVWAVARVHEGALPAGVDALFDLADAVVLDARVAGALGGTGVALPWEALQPHVSPLRGRRARLVLAGGLDAGNVGRAIAALAPDVVDVSSGVESAVGVKDHARMRAFCDAVRAGNGS